MVASVIAESLLGARCGAAEPLPRWRWADGRRNSRHASLAAGPVAAATVGGVQPNNSLNRTRRMQRSPSASNASARRLAQIR